MWQSLTLEAKYLRSVKSSTLEQNEMSDDQTLSEVLNSADRNVWIMSINEATQDVETRIMVDSEWCTLFGFSKALEF